MTHNDSSISAISSIDLDDLRSVTGGLRPEGDHPKAPRGGVSGAAGLGGVVRGRAYGEPRPRVSASPLPYNEG